MFTHSAFDSLDLHLKLVSTPEAVQQTLVQIGGALQKAGHPAGAGGDWELVLAEVMNNIVEHAYQDKPDGKICLDLNFVRDRLNAQVCDQGRAMPQGCLPDGVLTAFDMSLADLPEGGFGWFLIRSLTLELRYQHDEAGNHLHLVMAV